MKSNKLKLLSVCILFTGVIFISVQCQKSRGSNLKSSFENVIKVLPKMNNVQYYHPELKRTDFKWPNNKKMAISLTFDDARLTQIDKGIPLLDKYNVKGTFYISPNAMMQREEGWKKAIKNGHDIGNHTLTHPCTGNFPFSKDNALENRTLQSMKEEIDSVNIFIKERLNATPVSFAYPCGNTFVGRGVNAKSYIPLIASTFETGRRWYDEGPNDPSFCDLAQLTGMELDGKSFDEVLQLIESAKNNGQWLVLVGHEMDDRPGHLTSLLPTIEAICQYASDPANGIWIDNIHNVASFIREQRGEEQYAELPIYKNPMYSIDQRVDDLLSQMTLEEKIGQMNMPCVYLNELGRTKEEKFNGVRAFAEGIKEKGIGPGGGFFALPNEILLEGPKQQAEFNNELQKIAVEKTRLGIPLLMTEEGTHGLMCSGGTIFPEGLAIGSTWNMNLVNNIYSTAAREARAIGIHQLFTLVIEPNRDPRLGRNEEAYSEDTYLTSVIAENIVRSAQGDDVTLSDKVVAGLCHYPGQSQPASGLERGAMEVSERVLREVFLPSWIAGIKKAGALGVMATYPAIDGIPVHASEKILTKILREELHFKGLVLGEGGGISTNVYERVAPSQKEAGELALKAGLDVGISYEKGYLQPMLENIREGKIDMSLIDRAVRRILELKFKLGLFENPYVNPDYAVSVSNTKENRELAREVSREGIVLLKNEKNILPLNKDIESIAVIGPNANNGRNQLGDYTTEAVLQNIVTVLDGIKSKVSSNTKINYVKGCEVIGDEINEINAAVDAAKKADVAIVVLGESHTTGKKTNGEGYDVASLDLTGMQEELLKAVYATNTPTVVVLINGRPLSVRWAAEKIPAIVEAWNCGEEGGNAVADILFGDYNPSGKLSITIPRHVGQFPFYYNYKPSKKYWVEEGWGTAYVDMPTTPLWEFGYGLSYTTFEYSNLKISPKETGRNGVINVQVDVKNIGKSEGKEVVQLYINDIISSVVTPVKGLKGFSKINLLPGEKKTVEFILTPELLSLFDKNLNQIVEPGFFEVMIGSSSEDIKLKGKFEIK